MSPAAEPPSRPLLLLSAFAFVGFVILCGLGAWQLQRLGEKGEFLSRLAQQASTSPGALPAAPQWPVLDLDSADLTRLSLSGAWLPDASATVRVVMPEQRQGARGTGGFGRYMINAVRLDDGGIVLVNRGFVPEALVGATPAPTGRTELVGILRKPEARNSFTPAPNLANRDFHVRDPASIAAALGLQAAPFMVEAERSGDARTPPIGVDIAELIARIPNNHLHYAFTWFGLAAALVGVFLAYLHGGAPRA